jgi:flagellar basal-body rod protein FlgF
MDIGAYIAASGAIAVQRDTESITHNLANSSTPGFKRLLNQVESVPFAFQNGKRQPPDRLAFAALGGQVKDRSQGELERTGESLDLAIQGPGYFVVRTSAGTQLTRDGHFHLDTSGRLVSRTGLPVEKAGGGEIRLEGTENLLVLPNGEIRSAGQTVGRLQIVDDQGNPLAEGKSLVAQGYLEGSTGKPFEEMVRLMERLRAYQSFLRLINGLDDLDEKIIQEMNRT